MLSNTKQNIYIKDQNEFYYSLVHKKSIIFDRKFQKYTHINKPKKKIHLNYIEIIVDRRNL